MQLATIIPNLEDTQHVKGHQDSKKKFDDLSRPAQLNTLADRLATRQLDHLLQENATQDMLPLSSNPVYLYNNTAARLVTSKEPNAAKWAWSTQRMFKYWSKRLSLPMKDIQSIDWEGLKHTKKTLTENQKVFCYKLSADWLPTGHRMDLIGNLETECPSCSSPQETLNHLYLCKSRENWRADTLKDLYCQLIQIDTPTIVMRMIMHGIHKWFDASTPDIELPEMIQNALDKQNKLGWDLWFRGFHSQAWSQLIGEFTLQRSRESKYPVGLLWAKQTIKWSILTSQSLWKTCNELIHNTANSRLAKELAHQITYFYSLQDNVLKWDLKWDKALFHTELHLLLQSPMHTLQAWVKSTKPHIQWSLALRKIEHDKGNQDIQKFFAKAPKPPPCKKAQMLKLKPPSPVKKLLRTRNRHQPKRKTNETTQTPTKSSQTAWQSKLLTWPTQDPNSPPLPKIYRPSITKKKIPQAPAKANHKPNKLSSMIRNWLNTSLMVTTPPEANHQPKAPQPLAQ